MVNAVARYLGVGAACAVIAGCGDDPRIEQLAQQNRQLQQQTRVLADRLSAAETDARKTQLEFRATLTSLREKWRDIQTAYDDLTLQLQRVTRERDLLVQSRDALNRQAASQSNALERLDRLSVDWQAERRAHVLRVRELEAAVAAYERRLNRVAEGDGRQPPDAARRIPAPSPAPPSRREVVGERLMPTPDNTLSRREFGGIVQGMTESEVRTYLGNPDKVDGSAPRWLIYERSLTHAIEPGTPDAGVRIRLDAGVVTRCVFP